MVQITAKMMITAENLLALYIKCDFCAAKVQKNGVRFEKIVVYKLSTNNAAKTQCCH
jgi:hypothetical protein